MLAIKLLLTPALIGMVTLMGRRWGPAISGWFVGLPLTSGPITLYLALAQGTTFAAHAAEGTLLGLISVACFCLIYSWVSLRVGWLGSLLVSWCGFFVVTFVLEQFSLPLIVAFIGVVIFLAIALKLFPVHQKQATETFSLQWEVLLRMVTATAFVLALTEFSSLLGPQLSGLLTPFPIFATILGTFTHSIQGSAAASRLLRGVVIGTFTFAVFFLIIATTIEREGIAVAFSIAVLASLLLHGCSLWFLRRFLDAY
ncbi:MAG: hypothetical protein JO011_03160 [Ktedonobacteraceae bacterium]|nr:hypothetical protein [Ktedonobacteraceae bacterium]